MIRYLNGLLYWSTGSKVEKPIEFMNNLVAGEQLGPKISNFCINLTGLMKILNHRRLK